AGDLFAIEVDADGYAETVAGDVAAQVSRTHQSEADFNAQKASYSARFDNGNLIEQLYEALPLLKKSTSSEYANTRSIQPGFDGSSCQQQSRRLDKREAQLVGYAMGELYYDRRYATIVDLCERLPQTYGLDAKTATNLKKWIHQSSERM
ncbi:hypothetical protein K431DRAFT_202127, partial [Polychaeton citri CBS 116435]